MFSIFYDINMSTKSKTDSEFSRVSFSEILENLADWYKMFYFSRSSFFKEIYTTSFFTAIKDINLQKLKNLPLQTLVFSWLKFISHRMQYAVKILEDFNEGNSRKSQIKV